MGRIRINVKVFATLRRFFPDYDPEKGIDVTIEEGATFEHLIQSLHLPPNEASVILVNGLSKKMTDRIMDGDQINIFAPMGGG